MRILRAAAVFGLSLLAAPTFAEELTQEQIDAALAAIEESGVDEPLYQYLWCGAAFSIVKEKLAAEGNPDAESVTPLMDAIYTKAATEAVTGGISEEDFVSLSQNFIVLALSQTGEGGEADYSLDDCQAAAQ